MGHFGPVHRPRGGKWPVRVPVLRVGSAAALGGEQGDEEVGEEVGSGGYPQRRGAVAKPAGGPGGDGRHPEGPSERETWRHPCPGKDLLRNDHGQPLRGSRAGSRGRQTFADDHPVVLDATAHRTRAGARNVSQTAERPRSPQVDHQPVWVAR